MKGVMSHIGTNLPIRGVTCRRYTYLLTVNFRILLGESLDSGVLSVLLF